MLITIEAFACEDQDSADALTQFNAALAPTIAMLKWCGCGVHRGQQAGIVECRLLVPNNGPISRWASQMIDFLDALERVDAVWIRSVAVAGEKTTLTRLVVALARDTL